MSKQKDMIFICCHQCGDKFEIGRKRKPRPYACTKKCYKKYHKTKNYKETK